MQHFPTPDKMMTLKYRMIFSVVVIYIYANDAPGSLARNTRNTSGEIWRCQIPQNAQSMLSAFKLVSFNQFNVSVIKEHAGEES